MSSFCFSAATFSVLRTVKGCHSDTSSSTLTFTTVKDCFFDLSGFTFTSTYGEGLLFCPFRFYVYFHGRWMVAFFNLPVLYFCSRTVKVLLYDHSQRRLRTLPDWRMRNFSKCRIQTVPDRRNWDPSGLAKLRPFRIGKNKILPDWQVWEPSRLAKMKHFRGGKLRTLPGFEPSSSQK